MSFTLSATASDVVIKDAGIEITREEMIAALELIPSQLTSQASTDNGVRLELINNMLQLRKLAALADQATPDDPGYWELQFQLLATKRQYAFERQISTVSLPDPRELAMEYYDTQKEKYARRVEMRASSHILLASPPGLPREEVRALGEEILVALRDGASFESYVEQYSEDPGSKARAGSLNAWMRFGDPGYTPPYSEALFAIEEIGGYSEVTDSQFGIHIIRLDGIQEAGYRSFEEVKENIYKDIVAEFKSLLAKEVNTRYNITDDAFIDGDAMNELFAPYQPETAE